MIDEELSDMPEDIEDEENIYRRRTRKKMQDEDQFKDNEEEFMEGYEEDLEQTEDEEARQLESP